MIPATIINMSTEREEQEHKYNRSNDDIKILRKEVNGLGIAMSRIEEAITGNDLGQTGLVKQIELIRIEQGLINKRLDNLEEQNYKLKIDSKERLRNWATVFGLAGTILGMVLNFVMNKFLKK